MKANALLLVGLSLAEARDGANASALARKVLTPRMV